jgi:hypothetical protein
MNKTVILFQHKQGKEDANSLFSYLTLVTFVFCLLSGINKKNTAQ